MQSREKSTVKSPSACYIKKKQNNTQKYSHLRIGNMPKTPEFSHIWEESRLYDI